MGWIIVAIIIGIAIAGGSQRDPDAEGIDPAKLLGLIIIAGALLGSCAMCAG